MSTVTVAAKKPLTSGQKLKNLRKNATAMIVDTPAKNILATGTARIWAAIQTSQPLKMTIHHVGETNVPAKVAYAIRPAGCSKSPAMRKSARTAQITHNNVVCMNKRLGLLILFCCMCGGALFYGAHHPWVDLSSITLTLDKNPTIILDDEGNEWARFTLDRREAIALDQVPAMLIDAFLTAEDRSFFTHTGISLRGIIRSALHNLRRGRIVQGASTITQQLVKLLFLDHERTFKRKIHEQLIALIVEYQYTKEQILQAYLNNIYCGCGIYGVHAASQRFFQCDVKDLSPAQCATLAAIVRSPALYCPLTHPERTKKLRNVILASMLTRGVLSPQQYDSACKEPVIAAHIETPLAPHAREYVRMLLEEMVGRQKVYTGGLIVQTTINRATQRHAEQVFHDHVQKLRAKHKLPLDGGIISVDPRSGDIKALVGGYDFSQSQFNRAIHARRQMGSALKPIMYATAIERGISMVETEIDEPLTLIDHGKTWEPQNHTDIFEGEMTRAEALIRSNNIIAVKTIMRISPAAVVETAHALGLRNSVYPYPSLALGCIDVTLCEVAAAFAPFANTGEYVTPRIITCVKESTGKKVWRSEITKKRVFSWSTTSQITSILTHVTKRYSNWYTPLWPEGESLGKTGTTNDMRTCLFCGATPYLVTAVYIGCDDNRDLYKQGITTSKTAVPVWGELYARLKLPAAQFTYEPSLVPVIITTEQGKTSILVPQNPI